MILFFQKDLLFVEFINVTKPLLKTFFWKFKICWTRFHVSSVSAILCWTIKICVGIGNHNCRKLVTQKRIQHLSAKFLVRIFRIFEWIFSSVRFLSLRTLVISHTHLKKKIIWGTLLSLTISISWNMLQPFSPTIHFNYYPIWLGLF